LAKTYLVPLIVKVGALIDVLHIREKEVDFPELSINKLVFKISCIRKLGLGLIIPLAFTILKMIKEIHDSFQSQAVLPVVSD
jgi:hypothetical protein